MRTHGREAGQSTLDYLGVIIVGVVVVLGLVLTPAGPAIKGTMDQAVCAVTTKGDFGGGDCVAGGESGDQGGDGEDGPDYEPDSCTVSTANTTRKVEASIVIIDLGGESGVSIAEIRHADGTVEYRVTNERKGEGGVGVGIGAGGKGKGGGDGDDPGAAAKADLGIKGSYTDGNTYKVDTLEEARALQDRLLNNPWADVGEPAAETVTWGGEFNGSVDLGLGTGSGGPGGPGDDEGGTNLGGGFGLSGSHSYATTTDYNTGETTYVTSWSGTMSANADAAEGLNYSGSWTGTTSMAIVRDANGQIVRIDLVTKTAAGSTLKIAEKPAAITGKPGMDSVRTIRLPVTDANRGVVDQWLGSTDNYAGFTPLSTMFWNPTEASTDPMQNLVFNEAQVSQVDMQTGTTGWEVGGEVKWGIKLGGKIKYSESTGEVVEAVYAGEPADGRRPWMNMEVCFP